MLTTFIHFVSIQKIKLSDKHNIMKHICTEVAAIDIKCTEEFHKILCSTGFSDSNSMKETTQ